MAHLSENGKALARIKRIRGQLEAVERAIENDSDCFKTLQTLAACKGAINGLFSDLTIEHILNHAVENSRKPNDREKAALDVAELIKKYWK
jgi:DNA-binding FrmR family transcriptional regulator